MWVSIALAKLRNEQARENLFSPPISVVYLNAHPHKSEDNKIAQGILKKSLSESLEIMSIVMKQKTDENIKIVLVGRQVESAFKSVYKDAASYHVIPHPSGRNFQLNDKNFILEMLEGLRAYIEAPPMSEALLIK